MERQHKVAGGQPPCRRERRWPVRMKGKAPLPFDPSGGVGQGCAGQMCGRDARVPGWASSTQQTGDMTYVTPRNGARGCLQGAKRPTAPLPFDPSGGHSRRPAGKCAGVPPATPRERGRLARSLISGWRKWSDSTRLPAGSHPAGVNGDGKAQGNARRPPGNAGVPPATLFLAGGDGAVAQRSRQATTQRA